MHDISQDMTVKQLAKNLTEEYFLAMNRLTKYDEEILRKMLAGRTREQVFDWYKRSRELSLETIMHPENFQEANLDNAILKWAAALNLLIRHNAFERFAFHECMTPPRCHVSHIVSHDVAYQFLYEVFFAEDIGASLELVQKLWIFDSPSPIVDDVPVDI